MKENVGAEFQAKHIPGISLCRYCYTGPQDFHFTPAPSMTALSHKEPASAETTFDSCGSQESDRAIQMFYICVFFFSVALRPNVGHGLLIVEVS